MEHGPKDSEISQHESVGTTKYFFFSPRPYLTLIFSALIYILIYYLIMPSLMSVRLGLFLLSVLFSPFIVHVVLMGVGGITYLRRWTLLLMVNALVLLIPLTIRLPIARFHAAPVPLYFLFGTAACLFYGVIVFRSMAAPGILTSVLCALIMPAALVIPIADRIQPGFMTQAVLFWLSALIASTIFLLRVKGPSVSLLGREPYDLLQPAFTQFATKGEEGRKELESFFESLAKDIRFKIRAIRLRSKQEDCHILVPNVHPGPYGRIGGSNISEMLSRALHNGGSEGGKEGEKMKKRSVLVMHGASTHEQDPVNLGEVKRALGHLNKKCLGIPLEQGGISGVKTKKKGKMTINYQRFGDALLCTYTSAPEPTDDVDREVGKGFEKRVVKANSTNGIKHAVFVDCHNSLEPGTGSIYPGSDKASQLVSMANDCSSPPRGKGFGFSSLQKIDKRFQNDLGPCGLSTLVIEAEGKSNAYIILDGNNMVVGLRDKLIKAALKLVDKAEILTTDSHYVNLTMGGYRPVGSETDHAVISEVMKDALEQCKSELMPGKVGSKELELGRIHVLGKDTPDLITKTINQTVSMLRPTLTWTAALFVAVSVMSSFIFNLVF